MDYFNAKGSFLDGHTVQATSHDGTQVCHLLNIISMYVCIILILWNILTIDSAKCPVCCVGSWGKTKVPQKCEFCMAE